MRTYLWRVSYTATGSQGLLGEGGTSRRATLEELVGGLGGNIDAWYYAFGDHDLYVIANLPSDEVAAAVSLQVAASGAAQIHTTVLLTAEQIDAAAKTSVAYRSPGA
jgi:uncharacterized protein with GYD domain